MENTDAKVYAMIEDLSRNACMELLGITDHGHSMGTLHFELRAQYESGEIPSEEIIAAWNDDTWNGKS